MLSRRNLLRFKRVRINYRSVHIYGIKDRRPNIAAVRGNKYIARRFRFEIVLFLRYALSYLHGIGGKAGPASVVYPVFPPENEHSGRLVSRTFGSHRRIKSYSVGMRGVFSVVYLYVESTVRMKSSLSAYSSMSAISWQVLY